MKVAVNVEFKADRKEPLGQLLRRVAAAFDKAGLAPSIHATFSDGPGGLRPTSAVERAIRKHPTLSRFERNDSPLQNLPAMRRLTNNDAAGFPLDDVLVLADGVPRSLPFHAVSVHFGHADFGEVQVFPVGLAPRAGISLTDSWWVNGRNRDLSAFYSIEASKTASRLPDPPAAVARVLGEFGKPKRSAQFVVPEAPGFEGTPDSAPRTVRPEIVALAPIVAKYRAGMIAMVERIGLPHDLPSAIDAGRDRPGASGPLKPALVNRFKERGYDCRGGGGIFTLRKRTGSHNVVELELDVGTWSRSLTSMFHVRGPGFNATVTLPVTLKGGGQYPIGDTANWEQIVANLAVIVDELERTFVPEIEAAAGAAPEWFEPGRS